MEKLIIFGSSGLVGSNLYKQLNTKNNFKIFTPSRQHVNLFNFDETYNFIQEIKPNWIINCAAKVGGIMANNTYRTEFMIENLKINLNLLESCINQPQINIINLGSSCIYPVNAENPIKENSFLTGKLEPTNSPYAIAKIVGMELGKEIRNQYGNKVINVMPTNLYGPGDKFSDLDSHVIPGLIYRMYNNFENNKFIVWGTGDPLREFLFIEDLAQAIEFIIANHINEELINVGANDEISIRELALLIKDIAEYKGEIIFDTTKPDGNPKKKLDTSLMDNYGWRAKTNIRDGLEKTISWYKTNLLQQP